MNKAQITALAIVGVGALWIGSGFFVGGAKSPRQPAEDAARASVALPSVRVMTSVARLYEGGLAVQGRTMASRTVELRAEVSGRIERVFMERGQKVAQGQELIRIAVNDRAAKLEQARAFLQQRAIQVQASRELAQQNFNSKVRLAEAEAQYAQAKADVDRFQLDLANTQVRAPFDGVMDTRVVDEGAFLNNGDRIGTIVDLDPIKITAQLAERNVTEASPGMAAKVVLSNGAILEGKLNYIAAVSDPNTRTFTVEVQAPNPDNKVLAGLAAQLRLPFGGGNAHRVPPSALTLADDGKIGLKALDDGNRVKFWAVEIVDDGPDGTWVTGLPDQVTVIVVGQEYVAVGQHVMPVAADKTS